MYLAFNAETLSDVLVVADATETDDEVGEERKRRRFIFGIVGRCARVGGDDDDDTAVFEANMDDYVNETMTDGCSLSIR